MSDTQIQKRTYMYSTTEWDNSFSSRNNYFLIQNYACNLGFFFSLNPELKNIFKMNLVVFL